MLFSTISVFSYRANKKVGNNAIEQERDELLEEVKNLKVSTENHILRGTILAQTSRTLTFIFILQAQVGSAPLLQNAILEYYQK